MSDIVEFLKARLDEDEAVARSAFLVTMPGTESWSAEGMKVWTKHDPPTLVVVHTWPNEAAHIVRHDPARVLRESAAKRAIVRALEQVPNTPSQIRYVRAVDQGYSEALRDCLRHLASAYSDHPDYQQEWGV